MNYRTAKPNQFGVTKSYQNYQYNTSDILGQGQYSTVFKGIHIPTQQVVAIKVIDNDKVNNHSGTKLLQNEVRSLTLLKSPHILFLHQFTSTRSHTYFITEYCNQGSLKKMKFKSIEDVKNMFLQLIRALEELQQNYIVHRDIKPDNILFKNGTLKLADFGFSLDIRNQTQDKQIYGTPLYMSPESLLRGEVSFATDIWAAGITLYYVLYGQVPFQDFGQHTLKDILQQYQYDRSMLQLTKTPFTNLLLGMLDPNPTTRWTLEKIINYPYIASISPTITISTLDDDIEVQGQQQTCRQQQMNQRRNQHYLTKQYSEINLNQKQLFLSPQQKQFINQSSNETIRELLKLYKEVQQLQENENDIFIQWVILKAVLLQPNLDGEYYQTAQYSYKYLMKGRDIKNLDEPDLPQLLKAQFNNKKMFLTLAKNIVERKRFANRNNSFYKIMTKLENYLDQLLAF